MASNNDLIAVNTIRTLAADVVSKSNSGHPGAPMGMAPAAHVLWTRHLNFSSKNPKWYNRDRFVLSNGHACVLQYIMLHLSGYKVSMDDLKSFRQIDSITPGHPELGVTEGIEVTTGPLGQGISNAVGLAIAQAHLGAVFNKDGYNIIDNHTYVFLGDGCLQEGVASEACSLAGHLKLANLIAIYDDNKITIDGDTAVSFTEDVELRFKSYGWNVLHVENGDEDYEAIEKAISAAQKNSSAPTIINLKTTIGYGSLKAGGHDVHGAPLKKDDLIQLKKKFGFNPDETFAVPQETTDLYKATAEKGAKKEAAWNDLFKSYAEKYPLEASELTRRMEGRLPEGWEKALPTYSTSDAAVGSRKLSETTITKLVEVLPELMGGSADLTGSNLTRWKGADDFQHPSTGLGHYGGRYIRFGVREHGMVAICNGMAAYGGIIPFSATFLNFVSYAAGAVRLSALSHLRVLNVATHDSIGLGEDGPTHQPVETAAWLRAVPNLAFWRPADGNETSATYLVAILSQHTPSVMAFSRQNLPQLQNSSIEKATKGGYVLDDIENPDLTIVSTGSEVPLCVEAAKLLKEKGIKTRIVSMPCIEVFNSQDTKYKLSVLPSGAPVLSVEAYSTFGWGSLSHDHFGLKAWGASGPFDKVYAKFDMTPEGIAKRGEKVVAFYKKRGQPVFSPLISALDDITE
ncbi:Transketolase, thiamine diphosphate binding domain-domain-containing protein [Naematelia encephala]|uniref:Transketolase n=1 Tax=Naematelia encephala TaxID=71784 RepID=A0A1Y2AYZ1_9TREE|nr:Transketolase, thiamine diphosphate binding domain-domain-containing protein [Naematelia encephala]